MNNVLVFLSDYTLQLVALGSALLGAISGIVGSFAVLKKQSLLGDAVSHAALPGIAAVFIFTQSKNTEYLLLGALVTGLLATLLVHLIDRYSRIKFDSALALVLSVFFGFGLVLMTLIQKMPNANQAGLDKFIFGQASTLLRRDLNTIFVTGVVIIVLVILFWKELKISTFDPIFAQSIGFSVRKLNFLLSALIVSAIIIGLQTVGVILMSAMLVAPGAAARQWTDKLSIMTILAAFFGAISGVIGTIISSSIQNMPTGPSIVIVISLIVLVSMTLAPNRGLFWQYMRELKNRKNIKEEKVLLNLYYLSLNHDDPYHAHSLSTIKPLNTKAGKKTEYLLACLRKLESKGLVKEAYFATWAITPKGIEYISNHSVLKEGVQL